MKTVLSEHYPEEEEARFAGNATRSLSANVSQHSKHAFGGIIRPSASYARMGAVSSSVWRAEVPGPKFVNDYQQLMDGVDIHDDLRLQRYCSAIHPVPEVL
ncbi:TPA: LOW QUALITY PROTEIN: hypothetical protein N0F65_004669 [Lagenidium giganteum]|uniref:Uncharacterized protein n=1 Tax=Lagenidium giganteum TaxID=4803 RepID=A0AAV2ZCV3_9STRA|nr:TPA: LOW QUALITY PROTEIN: hypothetical protein N0F65_004669 [Lagenidium giganteum]